MLKLTRALALATMLALASACGGDDSNAPKSDHLGTYPLQSINGDPVPSVVYSDATTRVEITQGSLTIHANGTYTETLTYLETENDVPSPPETYNCTGTARREGNTITLVETTAPGCAGDTYTATYSGGNILTVNYGPGFVAIYRR